MEKWHQIVLFLVVGLGVVQLQPSESDALRNSQSALVRENQFKKIRPSSFAPWDEFERPQLVQQAVAFWVRIYTEFSSRQGLIHDAKHLDIVYEVVELKNLSRRQLRRLVKQKKRKWKKILKSVHQKRNTPDRLNDEERRVYDLFSNVENPLKFAEAIRRKRMRFQLGQSNHFKNAIKISGRYLREMEEIFKNEGLPLELTRLPFVESSFNVKARSKVGASGIWQFMRSTGRLYLKINPAMDERNDPLIATRAAARLLKKNVQTLKAWPLAVVAYNHGRRGMMRAVRKVGTTDFSRILQEYRGARFGFASRNFYPSLLAAVEVERNFGHYFGSLDREEPLDFVDVGVPDFISAVHLTREIGLKMDEFRELNPAFRRDVYRGKRLIPAGYRIRLPSTWGSSDRPREAFWSAYNKIPSKYKHRSEQGRQLSSRYDKNRR